MTESIDFTSDAELAIAAADGDKPAQVGGVVYSGGLMRVPGFGPIVIDLTGLRIASDVTLLSDHQNDRGGVIGSATATVRDGQVLVSGMISRASQAGQEIIALSKDGVKWQASVGVTPDAGAVERIRPGETITVNGRSVKSPAGGFRLVKAGQLREVSIVPMGADAETSVAIAAQQEGEAMPDETITIDADAIRTEERQRLQKIEATCRGSWGAHQGRVDDWKTKAVNGEMDVQELQANCLDLMRSSRPAAPMGRPGDSSQDADVSNIIEAALLTAVGLNEEIVGKFFDEQTMNAAVSRQWRGYTLHAAMGHCIRAAGKSHHGSFKSNDFIRTTLEADRELRAAAGGFSTLAVSNILENTAGKVLLDAYQAQETIWQFVCAIKNHSDFKVHSRYRLDFDGSYRKVGPDGELKHVSLSDAKYTNQVDTYGALISLTRQDIVNDDLDAFMDLPRGMGRAGAVRLEEAVFALLLSNPSSFFHANNSNLTTGASSALSIASLTTLVQKFMDQVDSNGKPIMSSPRILLVPTTLKTTADDLFEDTTVATRLNSSDGKVVARNPHAGLFRPYSSPYLNNTAITDQDGAAISGQSATAWYLFADPAVRAAMAVAFLNGQRQPTIESAESDFSTLGMQWRGFHDFGVGMEDPIAGQKSAGA